MIFSLQNLSGFSRETTSDKLEQRIIDCWLENDSQLDLAVLLRQWMRREWIRKSGTVASFATTEDVVNRISNTAGEVGIAIHKNATGKPILSVSPWVPDWVPGATADHPVDLCSGQDQRRPSSSIPADEKFRRLGHQTFRTNGQFAAVQAVRAMAEGSTAVVMLPTGSGKTEVALALIENLPDEFRSEPQDLVTVLIVPYVVLAKDLERRLQNLYRDRLEYPDTELRFAYTHDMSDDQKNSVLNRIQNGDEPVPGILITSPESLVGKFRDLVLDKARRGKLGAIIVDEAHLLYQSGVDFRLDFREVSKLRDDACQVAKDGGKRRPKTLLMSATIGDTELRHLVDTFGPVNKLSLIDAIEARDEPDIFVAQRSLGEERLERLREALSKLPRPALVYVTKPDHAKQLLKTVKEWGYSRARCVVAETPGTERSAILRDLRTDDGTSKVDLVIANSAFGLGIDCDEIRSVIHMCLPETIDRWYQEIGRGGRDGNRSVGLLLPDVGKAKNSDYQIAVSLSPTTLKISNVKERWQELKDKSESVKVGGHKGVFLDLRTKRNGGLDDQVNSPHSFDCKWNRTILYALQEYGFLSLKVPSENAWPELQKKSQHWDWVQVDFKKNVELDAEFDAWWEEFRIKIHTPFKNQLEMMWEVASGELAPCEAFEKTYKFSQELITKFRPSLQVQRCEPDCGHCASCISVGISPQKHQLRYPSICVAIEISNNELITQLTKFWGQVQKWNALAGSRVQILPVFVKNEESERFRAVLRSFVDSSNGWNYGNLSAHEILSSGLYGREMPVWSVIDASSLELVVDVSQRNLKFREDLSIPPVVVLMNEEFRKLTFVGLDSERFDWSIAENARWEDETYRIASTVLELDNNKD